MLIDELLQVLPPPERPFESGALQDWGAVTRRLGEPMPTDYMHYVDRFGSGTVNRFITVFNPFSRNSNVNLLDQLFVQLSALRELRAEFPESIPYPLFFEPGGLLPWGSSIDGDVYCWLTQGSSGAWPVVVVPRHGEVERFPVSMTQFVARCITGAIVSSAVPWPFSLEAGPHFAPLEGAA